MRENRVTVQLTNKELNYIDAALRRDIREMESHDPIGNIPDLLCFQRRLQKRLSRINSKDIRSRLTHKQKLAIARWIRRATNRIDQPLTR